MSAAPFHIGDRLVDVRDSTEYEVLWIAPAGAGGTSEADGPTYHARLVGHDGVPIARGLTIPIWSRSRLYPTECFTARAVTS